MEWRSRYNGTWVLFKNSTLEIYATLRHGLYYVYQVDSSNGTTSESLLNKDGYLNIEPLWINNNANESPAVYCLLENYLGDVCIMEIISKEIVLYNFDLSDYRSRAVVYNDKKGLDLRIIDTIIGLLTKGIKRFALLSLKNGYVFGPYKYTTIEEYKYGVILDNETIAENIGVITDISGYVKQGSVFYNEEDANCILVIDEKDKFFILLRPNKSNPNTFEAVYNNKFYSYDIIANKLTKKDIPIPDYSDRDIDQWTASDSYYAYEGHSELELGLD